MVIDLDPVDRLTAGAVGPPGQRVFYIQGRKAQRVVTVLVEKQQVELLSASILEVLSRAGRDTGEGPGEEELGLEEPLVPEWRAGRLSIGYDEARDRILLEAEELVEDEEEVAERGRVRFWASREQALAMARQSAAVAAAGRPRCQLCGNPMDPLGHTCPALNGHGELS